MEVTTFVAEWGKPLRCRVVRMDRDTEQLLLALPDGLDWSPHAEEGTKVALGWPDHDAWHEATAAFSMKMVRGSKILRLRLDVPPRHHERRRFVRVRFTRPVDLHVRDRAIKCTSVDISEVAIKLLTDAYQPVASRDEATLVFRIMNRHTEEIHTIALDGHVVRIDELSGRLAGRKHVVVAYDISTPARRDAVRGLVYELGLQERLRQQPALET
jgi:hypothetical protein